MPLSDIFKAAIKDVQKEVLSDNLLVTRIGSKSNYMRSVSTSYDFLGRIVTVQISGGDDKIIQFKDYDRDVLEQMREYLIQEGKKPMPLPWQERHSAEQKHQP